MALDTTSFAYALKTHYDDRRVSNMTYMDNPLLALMPKKTDFGGDGFWNLPVQYADPQRNSANFANGQANSSTSKGIRFAIPRKTEYSFASIGRVVMEASEGNANAFMEAATSEIDNAMNSHSRSLGAAVYGSGSGKIGTIASISTNTITLTDADDSMNFEVGMIIELSDTDGTGSVRSGTLTLTKVNRRTGVLTASVNITSGISAAVAGDFIFKQGDYGSKATGLAGWLPSSDPSGSDSFFSVNRSVDSVRLAGNRFDGSAMPIESALTQTAALINREGGKPTHAFMSHSKWGELVDSLGTKVQYVDLKVNAEIGFKGVQVNGPKGTINVIADQNCPSSKCYMLQLDTWTCKSLNKLVKLIDADGQKMLREASADAFEVRIASDYNFGCHAPGKNAVITL